MGGIQLDCTKCGFDNRADAQFCKKCGSSLKGNENIISRMNSKINILAVFLGMIVSILVLFVGGVLFSGLSQTLSVFVYLELVLLAMTFLGSIITGLFGSKNVYEGSINGGFLSLAILVLIGLMAGILFLAIMGVAGALSSLGSGTTSGALSSINPTTSSANTNSGDVILNLIEFIFGIILIFISGIIGGAFGFFLKDSIKKISM